MNSISVRLTCIFSADVCLPLCVACSGLCSCGVLIVIEEETLKFEKPAFVFRLRQQQFTATATAQQFHLDSIRSPLHTSLHPHVSGERRNPPNYTPSTYQLSLPPTMQHRDLSTSSHTHTQLYTVIKAFTARLPDELTINEGDTIDLISDDSEFDDGWYMGKNLTTGRVGLYPKVFTQQLKNYTTENDANGSKPSLLRSRSRRTPQGSPITGTAPNNYFVDAAEHDGVINGGVNRYVDDIDKALKELKMERAPSQQQIQTTPQLQQVESNSNDLPTAAVVSRWSPEQVTQYFSQFVDADVAQKFTIHKISGEILLELELAYLKELDISSFGTRFEIYKKIEELKNNVTPQQHVHDDYPVSLNHTFSSVDSTPSNLTNNNTFSQRLNKPHRFSQRPQSAIIDHSSRFSRSTPSPLPYNNTTDSLAESNELPDMVEPQHHAMGQVATPTQIQTPEKKNIYSPDDSGNNHIEENEQLFISPRRAPQPPSYPSPVTNNPKKFGIMSDDHDEDEFPALPKLLSDPNVHSRNSSVGNASSLYVDTSRRRSSLTSEQSNLDQFAKAQKRYSSVIYGKPSISANSDLKDPPKTPTDNISSGAKRDTVSASEFSQMHKAKDVGQRLQSEASTSTVVVTDSSKSTSELASPINKSTTSFRQRVTGNRGNTKSQTSAFTEGIRSITPDEAIKDADFSGWMFKRGNLSIGSWKHRFFTLHKTRLSYYVATSDSKEKGLIDITSHRVLPATEAEDKLSAVYAASAGYGRYCFKIVPPAPGSRKGLTFTQQKVHYFAVETKEEMRNWMSALMKATIELDETVPAISSCSTPTIPLQKAQELMAIARENARENFDNLQRIRENDADDQFNVSYQTEYTNDQASSTDDIDNSNLITSRLPRSATPSSTESSLRKPNRVSSNNNSSPLNGMSGSYRLGSGKQSPNLSNQPSSYFNENTPARMGSMKVHAPVVTKLDGDDNDDSFEAPHSTLHSTNSFSKRFRSLRRTSKEDK